MNLYEIKDHCRSNFNVYLKKAIEQIPPIQDVNFLDIGCGTGVSILEIAKITNYNLTAIDTDEDSLKILENKIQRSNYSERISVMRGAIETVNLPEKNYDIILAEGLFNIIGFENGLLISSGFLADNGYMIIHDELKDRAFKLQIFKKNQFKLIASYVLDEKVWWEKYYGCIEKQMEVILRQKLRNTDFEKALVQAKNEIKTYKENPLACQSIYYVVQKLSK